MARTLLDKVWDAHTVRTLPSGQTQLFIGLHLIHEVTTPQAFDGLKLAGRGVRRPDLTLATLDHNTPTDDLFKITDEIALRQIQALEQNVAEYGIRLEGIRSQRRGIVHITGSSTLTEEFGDRSPVVSVPEGSALRPFSDHSRGNSALTHRNSLDLTLNPPR